MSTGNARWYVYALCEPTSTGAVRYIGKARDPWERLYSHRSASGAKRIRRWIATLAAPPKLVILGEFESDSQALAEEKRFIREYRQAGSGLLNSVAGGNGGVSLPRRRRFQGFGLRMAARRAALGMSQNELAESCGFAHGVVSRLENGHRQPVAESAVLIARALDVSVEWLVTGEERAAKASAA